MELDTRHNNLQTIRQIGLKRSWRSKVQIKIWEQVIYFINSKWNIPACQKINFKLLGANKDIQVLYIYSGWYIFYCILYCNWKWFYFNCSTQIPLLKITKLAIGNGFQRLTSRIFLLKCVPSVPIHRWNDRVYQQEEKQHDGQKKRSDRTGNR